MRGIVAVALLLPALAAGQEGLPGARGPGPVPFDAFNDGSQGQPRKGGEVTVAVQVGFRTVDPDLDTSATTSEAMGYVVESLVGSDLETWEHVPALAESWDIEDIAELKDGRTVRGRILEAEGKVTVLDLKGNTVETMARDGVGEVRLGTSFTFHLRRGVKFHNGDPFTARDVEFTWKLLRNPKNQMPHIQGYFQNVCACEVLDDYTVRLTYSEQYWMALVVCGGYLGVRPHRAWDPEGLLDKDPDAFFRKFREHPLVMHPVGTGPYAFESYTKDVGLVLQRYDGWWGAGRPEPQYGQWPDRIRYRVIKDTVAQLAALRSGEIDYVSQMVPPDQFDEFFSNPDNRKNFAAVTITYPMYRYLGYNLRRDLWKDRRVRWAMAHGAVDLDRYIREVLKGRAERVAGDYHKYGDSYNKKIQPVPYDPEKAQELLAEAGWFDSDGDGVIDREGRKFEFEMLSRELPAADPRLQLLLQMQANLKKFGVKMTLRVLEWGAFLEKVEKGEFEACLLGWALASPPNRQDCYQIWHSSQIAEGGSNHVAYANPEVDDLLVKIRRELDPRKRHELEFRVQEILFDDQPYHWLLIPAEHRIYNKKWRGVRFPAVRPCHALNEWWMGTP